MAAVLAVGGMSGAVSTPAQADAWTQDKAGVDTVGVQPVTVPGYMPKVVLNSTSYTTSAPIPRVDPNALYGVDLPPNTTTNNAYNVAIIDPLTGKNTVQFAWKVATASIEQRNMAVDSGLGGGTEGFYSIYRGPYNTNINTPSGKLPVWFYAPGDAQASKMWYIPDLGYFGYNTTTWTNGGAVVNQKTGMLYLNAGLIQYLGGTSTQEARLSIFDPKTSTTYWSGALQPATPADKLWKGAMTTDPKGGNGTGSLMPGIAILASGDFVILVKGTDTMIPATDPMNTLGKTIAAGDLTIGFLVRVHPTFDNTPWTYSVMKMVTKDPTENSTPVKAMFSNNMWGFAFIGGKLIAETSLAELYSIDPLTGYWKYLSVARNPATNGPVAGSVAPQAQSGIFPSMTSAQTATSLVGHVYQSASTTYDPSTPLPGVTVALYEQNAAKGYTQPILISTAVTDSTGQYTFLLPDIAADGSVTYVVRPIPPLINGNPSYVIAGGVKTGPPFDTLVNGGTLYCADGTTQVGTGDGVTVYGVCPGLASPPALETLGTSVDPATFGAYGKITMVSPWNDPAVDFTINTTPLLPHFTLTKTADKPLYILGDPITYTVTVTNDGPVVGAATVADTVPASVTVTDVTCAGTAGVTCTPDHDGNTVGGTMTVPAGGSLHLTITGTIAGVAAATNTVTVTPTTPGCDASCGGGDALTPPLPVAEALQVPLTGGTGTSPVVIAGLALVVVAGIALLIAVRRRE